MDLLAIATVIFNITCLVNSASQHTKQPTAATGLQLLSPSSIFLVPAPPLHRHPRPRGTRAGVRKRERVSTIRCAATHRPQPLHSNRPNSRSTNNLIFLTKTDEHFSPPSVSAHSQKDTKQKTYKNDNPFKPYIPSIIIGNVQSINNKMDELWALADSDPCFKTCSLIALTETWLSDKIGEDHVMIDGFRLFRWDRDRKKTGKCKGGGVCVYVNSKWCHPHNCHAKQSYTDKNIELLTVSARPYYLPREFTHVLITTVYMPTDSNYTEATDSLLHYTNELETDFPDTLRIICGDFNKCKAQKAMKGYHQHVTCPTRGQNTLDLLFTNVKNSHSCKRLCALGRSDHNLIYLHPEYRPLTQREPPVEKVVTSWTRQAWDTLRASLECTDWSVLTEDARDVTEAADTVTSYINFCVESCVPKKTIKLFSNNKPWVNREVKQVLNKKKIAFKNQNKEEIKQVQKELKWVIKRGKEEYKKKIEENFKENDMRRVWKGMRLMSGCKSKNKSSAICGDEKYMQTS